jgi:xanthine/CO dehydrogenase XdhC/CoxF family maturation factor
MAKKKLKFLIPDVSQICQDAFVLLQYAFRIEKDSAAVDGDEDALVMLSEVHQALERFRKARVEATSNGVAAAMASRLASVYEKVSAGQIAGDDAYRAAIMFDVGGHVEEDENPNNPELVPGFFLLDKETIRVEGGPVEAAARSIAEFFDRGSRQIKEYRSRLKRGELKFNPLEREAEGLYHLHYDFIRLVLTKTLSIKPAWVTEIQKLLKEKNLAETRARRPQGADQSP